MCIHGDAGFGKTLAVNTCVREPECDGGEEVCRVVSPTARLRWGIAVDELEQDRLLDIAAGCGGTEVEFTAAP